MNILAFFLSLFNSFFAPFGLSLTSADSLAVADNAVAVVKEAKDLPTFFHGLIDKTINFGFSLLVAVVLFYVGRILIKLLIRWLNRFMEKRSVDPAARSFLSSVAYVALYALLITIAISSLGFAAVSVTALLASAGVAIGMGLSGQLQNLAGGIIILITKPFRVGDYVGCQGIEGTVDSVMMFHTIIITVDNKVIYVPNGALSSGNLTNYSKMKTRRNEWVVRLGINENFDAVKTSLLAVLKSDPRVLDTPSPTVVIRKISNRSIEVMGRAWCANDDFWDLFWDMNAKLQVELKRQGVNFPSLYLELNQGGDTEE